MGNRWLCILPESIPGSQNNCTIETPQAETVQLKWDGITTIPQSYADCGLIHFATSPNNSPQKRAKSHCLNNLILQLFRFIYSKQSFLALRCTCVRVDAPYSGSACLLVSEDREEAKQSQIRPWRVLSQRRSISQAIPQNLYCWISPPLTCALSEMQESVRQICYHSNTSWLFTGLQHLVQVTDPWEELLRKSGRMLYVSPVQKMQVLHENYLMTASF